jgi:hypothetical protein
MKYDIYLGGVAVGVGIVLMFALRWWFAEKHRLQALIPFVLAYCYGELLILSAPAALSALGLLSWAGLWAGNGLGYVGLVWGTGGGSPNVTRAHQVVLTDGGHVIVFLLTLTLIGLVLWAKKIPTWKVVAGILAGILLGFSGTIAGASAVPLGSGVNLLGVVFDRNFR